MLNYLVLLFNLTIVIDGLEKDVQETMCKELIHESFSESSVIFVEKSQSNCFYIIKSGTVGVYIDKKLVRKLTTGQHFGLIGILKKFNRTSTVIALTDCELFSIGTEAFSKMFKQINLTIYFNFMLYMFLRNLNI